GYFPITPSAYDEDVLKEVYDEFPQYTKAVDQLENTTVEPANQGALTEILPEARKIIETAIGDMYEGKDPQEALDDEADKITDALDYTMIHVFILRLPDLTRAVRISLLVKKYIH